MKWSIAVIGISALVLLGFFKGEAIKSYSGKHGEENRAAEPNVEPTHDTLQPFVFHAGTFQKFDYAEKITIKGRDEKGGAALAEISYGGTVIRKDVAREQDKLIVHLEFSLEHLKGGDGDQNSGLKKSIAAIDGSAVYGTLSDQGALLALKSSGQSNLVLKFWSRFMERTYVPYLYKTNTRNWQVTEKYNKNSYPFTYTQSNTQGISLHKSSLVHELFAFRNHIRFSSNGGKLAGMQIVEKIKTDKPPLFVASHSEINLISLDHGPLAAIELAILSQDYINGIEVKPHQLKFDDLAFYKRELGDLGFADIIDVYQRELSADEKRQLYFKALAWIAMNPERLGELLAEMKTWGDHPEKTALWTAALANAGSPEAQKVLVGLIQHFESYGLD